MKSPLRLVLLAALPVMLAIGPAAAANACFTASKTYRIHSLRGGRDIKDGWIVEGDAFAQCVRREEAADKVLRARYPETIYTLSLAATIGCHSPCD